jgi:hypothetical protein
MKNFGLAPLAAACALVATSAHASIQLDQASVPAAGPIVVPTVGTSLSGDYVNGQTFTAGLTGELAYVDLAVTSSPFETATGGFTVAIEETPGVILASRHIDLGEVPTDSPMSWLDIPRADFRGAGILLVADQVYRITLTRDPQTTAFFTGWLYEHQNALINYDRGHGFVQTQYGEFPIAADYGFRTYVSAPAPEPALWSLMILGVAGVGASLRWRRIPA